MLTPLVHPRQRLTFVTLFRGTKRSTLILRSKMKPRLILAAFIALGLAFGYCAGFVTSTIETVSDLPLSARSDSSHDGLTGVFQGMGRLAAAEIAAGNCGNKKTKPSHPRGICHSRDSRSSLRGRPESTPRRGARQAGAAASCPRRNQ